MIGHLSRYNRFICAINGLPEAALALKQLGDDKTVKWCTELAKRKLIHYNKEEREKGAEMIRTLQQPSKIKQWSWEHPKRFDSSRILR